MPFLPKAAVDAICAEVEELTGDKTLEDFDGEVQFSLKVEDDAVLVAAQLEDKPQ